MDDSKYLMAFQIISNAGNSKSASLLAIEAAREFNFEEAEKQMKEAGKEMRLAHQAQFEMLQQEATGNSIDVNIILVHAQDHLTMAIMSKDYAEEFMNLYKLIKEMMNKLEVSL